MAACRPAAERLLAAHPDPPPVSSAVDALTAVERVLPGETVVDETRRVARLGGPGLG